MEKVHPVLLSSTYPISSLFSALRRRLGAARPRGGAEEDQVGGAEPPFDHSHGEARDIRRHPETPPGPRRPASRPKRRAERSGRERNPPKHWGLNSMLLVHPPPGPNSGSRVPHRSPTKPADVRAAAGRPRWTMCGHFCTTWVPWPVMWDGARG